MEREHPTTDEVSYLIQILLPVSDGAGDAGYGDMYAKVRTELTDRFGGMTFYRNAPAEGVWGSSIHAEKDQIVVAEVMSESVDAKWWHEYRSDLERRFQQEEIVIRALPIKRL